MKNLICWLAFSLILSYSVGCNSSKNGKEELYHRFDKDMEELIDLNEDFQKKITDDHKITIIKSDFLKMRLHYKKLEAFAEYFSPTTVKLVNGAPLDEIEEEENAVFEPGGFQVIEELIYTDEALDKPELIRQVRKMQVNLKRIRSLWIDIKVTDSQILDAIRLELFRMITLGITGFDTPASGNGVEESKVVLISMQNALREYQKQFPHFEELDSLTENSIVYLSKNKSFNEFDRARFILEYINPLCISLNKNQRLAKIDFVNDRKLLRSDAATLFDTNAFDPQNLLVNTGFKATPERVDLGKKLFYESKLSGNGKTNCGSCHQPGLAYSDGRITSLGLSSQNIKRNAPTIMYAALQQAMFYDLRSPSLEDQASDVIHNKEEMHGSLEKITTLLGSDEQYMSLFKKAFPESDTIRPIQVQTALASFVRSLNPFSSPFDKFMRGNKKALTDNQIAGFNLFMGKAKCGTCHFMPLFNGTVPPDYQRTESEVLGVTTTANWKKPVLDNDAGRGEHNQFPQWKNGFKTSTIRNIAKTAPYMHNGAFETLQEVMEFYNEGGGAGLGLEVPNQTLSTDKLNLNQTEVEQVIDFMKSLTDNI